MDLKNVPAFASTFQSCGQAPRSRVLNDYAVPITVCSDHHFWLKQAAKASGGRGVLAQEESI